MELFDYFFQVILDEQIPIDIDEFTNIYWSLRDAVANHQYMELYNYDDLCKDTFCGFVTWEIRPSKIIGKIDIGITNLVIIKRSRGTYNLMKVINCLRQRYPLVNSFLWVNRKHNKELKEFNQRGKYVAQNLQPTR